MGPSRPVATGWPRLAIVAGILSLTLILFLVTAARLSAEEIRVEREKSPVPAAPQSLAGSSKLVDQAEALPGSQLHYTIVISNGGGSTIAGILVTDTLPSGLDYVAGSLSFPVGTVGHASGSVITWTGGLVGNSQLQIAFDATLTDVLTVGQTLTNTALIAGGSAIYTRTAATTVITASQPITFYAYVPVVQKPYTDLAPSATRPNSANEWVLNWDNSNIGVTGYELQESVDPNFGFYTSYDAGLDDFYLISQLPSFNNVFYYRLRATGPFGDSPWSDTVSVVGGYRDEFDDASSGWAVRRMSLWVPDDPEHNPAVTYADGNLELTMNDKWDWFVASPFRPAPQPPYALEYRARLATIGPPHPNLISHGAVVGGDWNGGACPDIGNVYLTTNCFNHFYNYNVIYHGPLKVLYEQVDYLWWCEGCNGPWLKRALGDWSEHDGLTPDEPVPDWHTYRIEVRDSGLTYIFDGSVVVVTVNTGFISDPYFGLFASTDEYRPSDWSVDWLEVMPLDN